VRRAHTDSEASHHRVELKDGAAAAWMDAAKIHKCHAADAESPVGRARNGTKHSRSCSSHPLITLV
jgi:hypothetical protein